LKDTSLVSYFGDIDQLGVKFDLEDDFVEQNEQVKKVIKEESPHLNEHFEKKEHKDKILKCYPLSYFQGSFTYYYSALLEGEN